MEVKTSIPVELHGRVYGAAIDPRDKFFQPENVVSDRLTEALVSRSALLALAEGSVSKDVIYEAYAKDLALLTNAQKDFEGCMRQALTCSFRTSSTAKPESIAQKVESIWRDISTKIPALGTV